MKKENEDEKFNFVDAFIHGVPILIFAIAGFIILRWAAKLCLSGAEYFLFYPEELLAALLSSALCCLLGSISLYICESADMKLKEKEKAHQLMMRSEKLRIEAATKKIVDRLNKKKEE